jgi:hypothetical protein
MESTAFRNGYGKFMVKELTGLWARSQNRKKRLLVLSCLSACLSDLIEQLDSSLTDFHEMSYMRIFRTCVQKIQFSLQYDKNNGHITWKPMYIYDNISLNYT